MLNKILPFLKQAVPLGLAVKGLASVNPQIASFIGTATASGYALDTVMSELRSIYSVPGEEQEKKRLAKKEARGTLRPDEIPKNEGEPLKKALKVGGAIATAASLGKSAIEGSKALIPEVLPALKKEASALTLPNKQKALPNLSMEKGLPNLGPKQSPSAPPDAQANASRAGMATTPPSPSSSKIASKPEQIEIPEHIDRELRMHMSQSNLEPIDAAHVVQALGEPKIKKDIMSLEKKHRKKFPDIAHAVYSAEQEAQQIAQGEQEQVPQAAAQPQEAQQGGEEILLSQMQELIRALRGQ